MPTRLIDRSSALVRHGSRGLLSGSTWGDLQGSSVEVLASRGRGTYSPETLALLTLIPQAPMSWQSDGMLASCSSRITPPGTSRSASRVPLPAHPVMPGPDGTGARAMRPGHVLPGTLARRRLAADDNGVSHSQARSSGRPVLRRAIAARKRPG